MKKEERMRWMIVGESTEGEKRTKRDRERHRRRSKTAPSIPLLPKKDLP